MSNPPLQPTPRPQPEAQAQAPANATFSVRIAEPHDLPGARALMLRCFDEDFGYGYQAEFHTDVDDLQGAYLDHPRHTLLVAVDDTTGEVIGTSGIRSGGLKPQFNPAWLVERYDPDATAQLVRVFTSRAWRGRGVARALVRATQHAAWTLPGYRVLALHSDPRSPGAERFWTAAATLIHDDRDGPSGSLHFELEMLPPNHEPATSATTGATTGAATGAAPYDAASSAPTPTRTQGDAPTMTTDHDASSRPRFAAPPPRKPQGIDTRLIHAAQDPDPVTGAVTPSIHTASTFVRESIDDDAVYRYARGSNPTRAQLEAILAELEHGAVGLAFSSGMAAVTAAMQLLSAGDHAVVAYDCYISTYHMFANDLTRFGIESDFVDVTDIEEIERALKPNTRMIYIESPSNPLLEIADLAALAEIGRAAGAWTVVDNTFASPYCQNPIDHGIDIVLHSATKYMGGHSDLIGGAAIARTAEIGELLRDRQYHLGAVPGPFDCWLLMRGLRTLGVRMRQHMANAQAIAEWLEAHPKVKRVYYPGLPSHPNHELAKRQMRGFSGMVSFEVDGGSAAARTVNDSTHIFLAATSLGGVESLIYPPTAWLETDPELMAQIPGSPWAQNPGLIRLSVGIEDVADLIDDLDQALAKLP